MTIFVAYHYPCPDGIFGCLAAWLRFQSDAIYLPHSTYSELVLPEIQEGSILFLIDFAGNHPFLLSVASKFSKVILLDHHKTALEMIEGYEKEGILPKNVETVLDMNRSGAMIAWDYFSSQKELMKDPIEKEELLEKYQYIQDNDLWNHKLPFSKEFAIKLGDLKLEYDPSKNPSIFETLLKLKTQDLIEQGKLLVHDNNLKIQENLKESFEISISNGEENFEFLAVFSLYPLLRSELGHQLAMKSQSQGKAGIGAVCYFLDDQNRDQIKVSLRGGDPNLDTSKISQHYGGGGHKSASSFMISSKLFESFRK